MLKQSELSHDGYKRFATLDPEKKSKELYSAEYHTAGKSSRPMYKFSVQHKQEHV